MQSDPLKTKGRRSAHFPLQGMETPEMPSMISPNRLPTASRLSVLQNGENEKEKEKNSTGKQKEPKTQTGSEALKNENPGQDKQEIEGGSDEKSAQEKDSNKASVQENEGGVTAKKKDAAEGEKVTNQGPESTPEAESQAQKDAVPETEVETQVATAQGAVAEPLAAPVPFVPAPEGRLIGQSVGAGGVNAPADVLAVLSHLESLGIITCDESSQAKSDEKFLTQLINRYQQKTFRGYQDGLIEAGGNTETNLIAGKTQREVEKKKAPEPVAPQTSEPPKVDPTATEDPESEKETQAKTVQEFAKELWDTSPNVQVAAYVTAQMAAKKPELPLAVLAVAEGNTRDNFAYHFSASLSDGQLAALAPETRFQLANAMLRGFLTPGERKQIGRLTGEGQGKDSQKEGASPEEKCAEVEIESEEKELKNSTNLEDVGPLLSPEQFHSQLNGPVEVPLDFLKANMDPHSSETSYRYEACYQTCRYILLEAGFSPQGLSTAKYIVDVAVQRHNNGKVKWKEVSGVNSQMDESLSQLDEMLNQGIPVIAGVNRTDSNDMKTNSKLGGDVSPTDHFIVIIGRKIFEDGTLGYQFFDPGRTAKDVGASPNNYMKFNGKYFKGKGYGTDYTLSETRKVLKQPT